MGVARFGRAHHPPVAVGVGIPFRHEAVYAARSEDRLLRSGLLAELVCR
jgi:hypothetical protein